MNSLEHGRIPNEELGNLLAAVGNHEAKANLLLCIGGGGIYTRYQLYKSLIESQGQYPGWRVSEPLPSSYCQHTLAPIGLVAHEITDDGRIYGYQITEYGKKIGLPLAALMLDFSRRHPETSLEKLFGLTQSHSELSESETGTEFRKRSPLFRFKIFWELVTGSLPVRKIDLMRYIDENQQPVMRAHLEHLAADNLIIYRSIADNEPYSFFCLCKEPAYVEGYIRGYKTLTEDIRQFFWDHPDHYWGIQEVIDRLDLKDKNPLVIYPAISAILTWLRRKKFLEIQDFSQDRRSEIDLSVTQKDLLLEFVNILDGFQNMSTEMLNKGRKLAASFSGEDLANLMEKAKTSSHMTARIPSEESMTQILSALSLSQLTVEELTKDLNKHFGTRISETRIRILLSELKKQGKIKPTRQGGLNVWNIAV